MPLKYAIQNEPDTPNYEQDLRDLAQDIVKNIYEVPDILKKFGVSLDDYKRLAETTSFQAMLQDAATEWDSVSNTPERVKLKSALLVEKALPDMYDALTGTDGLAGRVELLKTLGKMGGLGHAPPPGAQLGASGSVFKLEINFPSQPTKSIVIEHAALLSEVEPPADEFGEAASASE